jgi:hypothetical protein
MLYMKEISSSEFRKVYVSLTEPTIVTVVGRPIGTYVPISTNIDLRFLDGTRPGEPTSTVTTSGAARLKPVVHVDRSFGAPQAAPKPGGKKR